MNLYQRLNMFCEIAGVSGYQMCKGAGLQPSLLTDLKTGRKKSIHVETAWKIADYFGISIDALVGRT